MTEVRIFKKRPDKRSPPKSTRYEPTTRLNQFDTPQSRRRAMIEGDGNLCFTCADGACAFDPGDPQCAYLPKTRRH